MYCHIRGYIPMSYHATILNFQESPCLARVHIFQVPVILFHDTEKVWKAISNFEMAWGTKLNFDMDF